MARQGLYTDLSSCTAARTITRDWDGTGIVFTEMKTGPGATPGTKVCLEPAVGNFTDLDARTDIKGINGARGFMVDRGTWGSWWVVANGAWFPEVSIKNSGTPEASVTAPIGALAVDVVAGANYKKTAGAGNTGWTAY
jgi:hypothetical protein